MEGTFNRDFGYRFVGELAGSGTEGPARINDAWVSYTGFALILFSGIAVSAVFALRYHEPDTHRPFRAWGYPWAPAIFVIASVLILANQIWQNPRTSAAGLTVIAAGVPMYLWMKRRNQQSAVNNRRFTESSYFVV